MKPLPLSPAARQTALAKSLYRKLFRECQRLPPNASLVHLDQWVGDTQIKDRETLRSCLRSGFRPGGKEGIPRALDGLKVLLNLDITTLSSESQAAKMVAPTRKEENKPYSLDSPICSESLLESVEWLEVSDANIESHHDSLELPVFPLAGPLFPDEKGQRLPLLSRFSDTPVSGMEIPLRIFEPRYRKMYQDLLSSENCRRFVVPFPHPYKQGTFAAFGWIYEIVKVKDVADESNGKFQLLCNHAVTEPIKIVGISNPENYGTQSDYLRCFANILPSDGNSKQEERDSSLGENPPSAEDLRPLEELLRQLQDKPLSLSSDNNNRKIDESLIHRLLMALGEGSIWPVVQVWICNLQTEILRLQMKVSTRIQVQAKLAQQISSNSNNAAEWQEFVTEEMVSLAQEPYESHLRCMLVEVSTMIPWLLQEDSHKAQCDQMCRRIRERLVNETTEQS